MRLLNSVHSIESKSVTNETKIELWAQVILLAVIIVTLLPYWLLAGFNHPSGDNFCYTNVFNDADIDGVIDGVIDWRRRWNGRYFALFLMGSYFVNFDMIATYQYPPLVLFGSWSLAAYYLLRGLTGYSDNRLGTSGVALGLCAIYTLTMPLVSNGFYHVTGAFQYQTGNILILATLGCLLRIIERPERYGQILLGAALVFATVGCTELHMVFMLFFMSAIASYAYWIRSPTRHTWAFLLLVTLLSAALLILAPGNEGRGQHFEARHQLWFSISESIAQFRFWFWEWVREPLLWLGTLAYLVWLSRRTGRSILLQRALAIHLVIGAACLLSTLLACFFVAYWSMGVGLPERALNVVYFIFLLGWFGLLGLGVGLWTQHRPDQIRVISTQRASQMTGVVVALAMTVGLISAQSVHTAYADLTQRARNYDEFFRTRYNHIKVAAQKNVALVSVPAVRPINRPTTIMVDDIRAGRRNFRNQCYAVYFGIQAIEAVREKLSISTLPVLFESVGGSGLSDYSQYVLTHEDLEKAWSESGKDINQWGKWHWTKYGEKEGRSFSPTASSENPTIALHREPNIVADHVSCEGKGIQADGRPDLVFSLDVDMREYVGPMTSITHIKLQRRHPVGINDTNDQNPILGVSLQPHGPLLNNHNGRMQIKDPVSHKRIWLFSCADGNDRSDSIYQVEALFRRDVL